MTSKSSEWFSLRVFLCVFPLSFGLFLCLLVGLLDYLVFVLCMFVRPRDSGSRETFRVVIETNPAMTSKCLGSRVFRF